MINRLLRTYSYCKSRNQKLERVRHIVNCFVMAAIFLCCVACSQVNASETKSSKKAKVIREGDHFKDINKQLKENSPKITSLQMSFVLNEEELKELYDSIVHNIELGHISWHKNQGSGADRGRIEKKLIDNNKNYRDFPNDYMHGLLSQHAYKDSKEKDPIILPHMLDHPLENWYVEKVYEDNDKSGYYGVIYRNDETHQIVLANRGTDEQTAKQIKDTLVKKSTDWQINFEAILAGQIMGGQLAQNCQATAEAIEIAQKLEYRLSFTGHSLGAWLAEMSVYYCHAYFDYSTTKGVVFDSPGALPMMERLQPNINNNRVPLENLDIVTYLASPNPVNICNPHPGKVYRVYPIMPSAAEYFSSFFPKGIQAEVAEAINYVQSKYPSTIKGALAFTGHDLAKILPTFDPQTGKPRYCQYMKDWPRVEYKGKPFSKEATKLIQETIKNYTIPENLGTWRKYAAEVSIDSLVQKLVGDTAIMTFIGFFKSLINDEVDHSQYWLYYKHKDFGDESREIRRTLNNDERFELVEGATDREGTEEYTLKPIPGSLDHFLYKLHEYKHSQNNDLNHLPQLVATQLNELLSNYDVEPKNAQGNNLIALSNDCDIECVKQKASRLRKVIPKAELTLEQECDIRNAINLLPNFPREEKYYIEIRGIKEELEKRLHKEKIVVLSGAGGMGKSTLAAEYGHNRQQEGWQVRWIKGTEIYREFLDLAQEMNKSVEVSGAEKVRNSVYSGLLNLFGKRQILFIFDNVENEEEIKQYLINLPNHLKVIIASRNPKILEGVQPIMMEGFSKKEAISYLRKALGYNEKEAEKLVKVISESPFRLAKVVAYLQKNTLKSVDEFLREYEEIKKGRNQNEEIYPEVGLLFRDLKKECYEGWRLLKYLAYLDAEGVPVEFIQNIMGETIDALQEPVNKLGELSLVDVVTERSQKILKVTHRIIQDETKKALIEENQNQVAEIMEKLIAELDKVFPGVSESSKNWKEAAKYVSHAKNLIQEAKEIDFSPVGKEHLLSKIGSYACHVDFNYDEGINYWMKLLDYQRGIYKDDGPNVAATFYAMGRAYQELGGEENLQEALKYQDKALKIRQRVFPGNHRLVARSLNGIGMVYEKLGGKQNFQKALQYYEAALKMYQVLLPGNSSDVSMSLSNVGIIYQKLGGEENLRKALQHQEDALNMVQALYLGNHFDVAKLLNNVGMVYLDIEGEGNLQKGKQYLEDALKMYQAIFPTDHPSVAVLLSNIGYAYSEIKGEENLRKGIQCLEDALNIYQAIFPTDHPDLARTKNSLGVCYTELEGKQNFRKGMQYLEEALRIRQKIFRGNHPDVARSLNNIGYAYSKMKGEKNLRKAIQYLEDALKMYLVLFPGNYHVVARTLTNVALTYYILGDSNKALEYNKQAYNVYANIFTEDGSELKKIRASIELLQLDFFAEVKLNKIPRQDCLGGNQVGPECRWIISSRGETTDNLIILKQKIQKSILNNIVKAVDDYGWSNIRFIFGDGGIKAYLEKEYIKGKLEELGHDNENIELAQMLCFESMNLGIMKSEKKPYDIIQSFTRENPELVKKIAREHPEFFVDGSIVEASVKAMEEDESFVQYVFAHVKYMGMVEEKEKFSKIRGQSKPRGSHEADRREL